MQRDWSTDEVIEHFTLLPAEIEFLGRNDPHNQLGKAVLLKFFAYMGRFPETPSELPSELIAYIAQQLDLSEQVIHQYDWDGRRIKEHRKAIRELMGFRPVTIGDQEQLRDWMLNEILPGEHRPLYLEKLGYDQLRKLHIEPPSKGRMKRLVTSAIHRYEQTFFAQTEERLSAEVKARLRALIHHSGELDDDLSIATDEVLHYPIHELKVGAGSPKVKNIKRVCARLKQLQTIELPADLFEGIPLRFLRQYRQQVAVESPSHLQRRSKTQSGEAQSLTMLAAFCWVRQREITDDLVDLLIRVLKDIRVRAQYREDRRLLNDFIRVGGKQQLLFRLAQAMLDHPDGIISEVLYPVIGEARLQALVEEAKNKGVYQQSVQMRVTASYSHHYRQILPSLLEVLYFRSNNEQYQPLIDALKVVEKYLTRKDAHYPQKALVPLDGVISKQWQDWVYQADKSGNPRIRRARYEVCVLQTLGEKLRCKEIWIEGADRYRNPAEDVPADFSEKRQIYYEALGLPLSGKEFVTQLKTQLRKALKALNDTLPDNDTVEILSKSGGWIKVRPYAAQDEPVTLRYLKGHIKQRWWMTSLLDVLKEVDLRVGFTTSFASLTGQQRLPQAKLQRRLLLCLFSLGTNTGLSSVSMGDHGVSYNQLEYTRRRFIGKDGLRYAMGQVVDATLAIKSPHIWGETTTWCASDSKQFGAWSQNLRAQWHKRYRQAGVMVYWHVAKQSICIYSQLKAPSSSEVSSMIEGVLRHCTTMQVDRNYVDTHGQSEVAFAFCHLLGFQLMPRFKNLHEQKLSLPDKKLAAKLGNLKWILQDVIDWVLVEREYDEMVKYATALRMGTADTEAILQRFTRNNHQHPTYKAFSALGRAIKTIFLCHYLVDEHVRIEIHEGLNVVENWNSANGFIFYGNRGEISSNDVDAQEIAMLSMHLLQACLVYVNTLMVQEVLAEPKWVDRMTEADWRGLTPLFYLHVNPYGRFDLDMAQRIPLAQPLAS
ncbi:MAG: Tn3 family transposase [Anaerolineae bacterium]|nr:Tn3 family transposase [Anaerolineae bacterium]